MNQDQTPRTTEANDNTEPRSDAIPFTDLCAAMGEDEDVALRRLAGILARREAGV